ncbi:benzoate/H(+) symporter BenE family transporter [Patulibacter sp. SYSU D01012]|uniref:benzoate/H(+) symporter BenE family transporter n=1 Tax=Patulibacter sp. SYSU D01012 TaxID=2817381 RepID=UPI001B30CA75
MPAGVVAALVGFVGSATVVLAGLRAVGADAEQAASGLLVLSLSAGVVGGALAWRTRLPLSVAWSTPGAALLVAAGEPSGGFAAAVGAFLVCGVLLAAAGLWGALARAVVAIPVPLAAAMTAGILLPVCFGPARAVAELPGQALPVVAVWGVLTLVARRLAVPGALLALVVVVALAGDLRLGPASGLVPQPAFVAPRFELGAIVGIALPLFLVTMASQNVAGIGVLASFGYRAPVRPVLLSTGAASAAGAVLGGHAINLAALSAALVAGPDAGPRARRWVAAVSAAATYVALALLAGLVVAFVAATPPVLVEAVAGLALLGALESALGAALRDEPHRPEAVATIVVAASGASALGIGGAFWGLLAGLTVHLVRRWRARDERGPDAGPATPR